MRLAFCVACGSGNDLQHHHLVTREEGGSNDETNLITLCVGCHDKLHRRQSNGAYNHIERVRAGLARAKAQGKRLGRKPAEGATPERIRELRAQGMGMVAIARRLKCSPTTVQRVLRDPRQIDWRGLFR